jgi:hypothetical protein
MAGMIQHGASFRVKEASFLQEERAMRADLEGDLDDRYLVQPAVKAMQLLQLICGRRSR